MALSDTLKLKSEQKDALAKKFSSEIDAVRYYPVTVENISRFADEAYTLLERSSQKIVAAYRQAYPDDVRTGKDLEDAAYEEYGLSSVPDLLDGIIDTQERIRVLTHKIPSILLPSALAITPPDTQRHGMQNNDGDATLEKRIFPRLMTLLYILEKDFGCKDDMYTCVRGMVLPTQVRQEPYVRVDVPSLNRIVYVCDEEGNISFVFNSSVLKKLNITTFGLDVMTKEEKKALLQQYPYLGTPLVMSQSWRRHMAAYLSEGAVFSGRKNSADRAQNDRVSEFETVKFFETYAELEADVRRVWDALPEPKPRRIGGWYQAEYGNRKGWHSNPHRHYEQRGWKSWRELVGREKKEYFETYAELEPDVRLVWDTLPEPKPTRIDTWYRNEQKRRAGWYSGPNELYKERGWKSWPELVGREKNEYFETYAELEADVRRVWNALPDPKPTRTQEWYGGERKKHPKWISNPDRTFALRGWKSYPALVGIEKD